ncbi:hypothetical protein V1224_05115 [Lachnospiraceae bacterium JLR.KK008]
MIFLGSMFCADIMSVPCTPTDMNNIVKADLSDGEYDDLRVSQNVTDELKVTIPQEWDWDTILHAKFNGNTCAGNVNWRLDTVSHLIIKRKKAGDFKWITLETHKVETIADFNIKNIDITARPDYAYQYAAVPIINGREGFYFTCNVEVKSNSLMIADQDEVWNTNLSDNYLDNTSIVPQQTVTTMYDKYPTIVRNTEANYEEITVNAQFFPTADNGCEYILDDDQRRINYNNAAKLFLRNGKPKILKSVDGNLWLVYVTTPPSDTAVDDYRNRKITFTCTEVGDPERERDLYDAGFITATEEWWNR